MNEEKQKPYGKYVPVLRDGRVKLYLPLERHGEIDIMKARGYQVDEETQSLILRVRRIEAAEERRAELEEKKRRFVEESLRDFSREVGCIEVLCPYCLGKINQNWGRHQGDVLCGWYDWVTHECNGKASYTIDRANLILGIPEVEKYTCPVKGTQLDLAIYELKYLKDEVIRRRRTIQSFRRGETSASCEAELSEVFPIRISVGRTSKGFKEFICSLMGKDAIDWLNTLTLEDLASLLEADQTLHTNKS